MKNWLKNKTIVITGASSGFGRLIAEKAVKRYGCTVIGIGRNREKLEKVKSELGDKFTYFAFDVGVEEEWGNFAEKLAIIDLYPDILINNAGVLPPFCRFESIAENDAEQVFKTNFFASVYSVRHILPLLKKHSATPAIINVSSSAILAQVAGTSIYSSSKSALASFTKILALENKNIYVALVCPGFSDTAIFRSQKQTDEKSAKLIKKVCSNPDKITDKLLKKLIKRKKYIILGADARAMHFFGKLFPSLTDKAISAVLKKSRLPIFDDVFAE